MSFIRLLMTFTNMHGNKWVLLYLFMVTMLKI